MDLFGYHLVHGGVDGTMARHARLPLELRGDDEDVEMTGAAGCAGMTRMPGAIVLDFHVDGVEVTADLGLDSGSTTLRHEVGVADDIRARSELCFAMRSVGCQSQEGFI